MKKMILVLIAALTLVAFNGVAFAHSGRTDAFGGHWNRVSYGVPVYEYHGY